MTKIENVTVSPEANVYFDGKCVSHTVHFPDGSRKSVGVILPSCLTFNTGAPEIMELVKGRCRVRLGEQGEWVEYQGGQQFSVAANSRFDIEPSEPLHYICHFG
jgi:purine/pyrimidine-nucleoside phosphorylase